MKKKIVWLVVTGWMVATLLLASCAPAVVKEEAEKVAPPVKEGEVVVPKEVVAPEKGANFIKWTGTKLDGTVVEKMIEKPRYGGWHTTTSGVPPTQWDDLRHPRYYTWGAPVNDSLTTRYWTMGPGGTGEWSAQISMDMGSSLPAEVGQLAERWEIPDDSTIIWHIRKGVHWALDLTSEASRLVGGREMTAADVLYTMKRNWTIGYQKANYPYLSDMKNVDNSIYFSPTDKWAVVMKSQPRLLGLLYHSSTGHLLKIFAPEVIEKYREITNWRHVVGTGPFMLKDYVSDSSITFVRNPNYWQKDPFFPENQLPYIDGFTVLIIPDLSTQMAALRTGQIDHLPTGGTGASINLDQEMADSLMKTNPELEWVRYIGSGGGSISMRVDTKPFDDIRVRQALAMAINRQELVDSYYGGNALLFHFFVPPVPEYMYFFTPLEKMPRSVQELYEYHPDKAKQLLVEAGYPAGFKTEIIALAAHVDLLSIIKEHWAKIGVDLKIEVRDFSVYTTIGQRKTHTQMYASSGGLGTSLIWGSGHRPKGAANYSMIDTPWYEILRQRSTENYFNPAMRNAIYTEPMAEGMPNWNVYVNEQAWSIDLPVPYQYLFWQPWLKGYYGANYAQGYHLNLTWPLYVWIDQELKKAMGR